ncbi:helix-turn-helix domain-containing protein [Actinomadura rupiterrae]|uniref:helix-turn-helix domain-containing protein n=1 Tax=Actinomadura rupiterrae TaxID=559627 RepID=UPI0020A2C310|nr:helix-turn-helix transcriptional regulator [Actinomadura rupiterrae]MCP2336813.1 transcriptional regulator with XRE-family HTH domain [Actinomadura rupiterrae]
MTASREPYEGRAIRAFARELTAWREQLGISKAELAARLGYDASLVGQIEACKNIPSRKFAEDCDTFFPCAGAFVRYWDDIEEERDLSLLPPGFPDFLAREAKATVVHVYEASIITGLFQTPEYAYEILKISYPPDKARSLLEMRMARAAILEREKPPTTVVVFDESAVLRRIGDRDVMRGQYKRLIEVSQLFNVSVQVVPMEAGAYPGIMGSFSVLGFESGPNVAYSEGHVGGLLTEHRPAVREYEVSFDLIRGVAKSASDSLKLFREALEAL